MFERSVDWLMLRDFDKARRHNRVAVIRRYARGNVSFQNGNICDQESLTVYVAKAIVPWRN